MRGARLSPSGPALMEKELKKLGEVIYWSAQKFNIWEFAAA